MPNRQRLSKAKGLGESYGAGLWPSVRVIPSKDMGRAWTGQGMGMASSWAGHGVGRVPGYGQGMGRAYGQGIWAGHMNRAYGQSI